MLKKQNAKKRQKSAVSAKLLRANIALLTVMSVIVPQIFAKLTAGVTGAASGDFTEFFAAGAGGGAALVPFIALAVFVLYIVLINVIIRVIVLKPLRALTDAVDKTGAHLALSYEGDVLELAVLADAINAMYERIRTYTADLGDSIKQRDENARLLKAVNDVASALLSASGTGATDFLYDADGKQAGSAESGEIDFNYVLSSGMALLAKTVGAHRVVIWQNSEKDGKITYTQVYQWLNEKGKSGSPVKLGTVFTYEKDNPLWFEKFSRREVINGPVDTLTEFEQGLLNIYGTKSILVIPVHIRAYFWGFVGFEDCENRRVFSGDEISILRSGAFMMINAIDINEHSAQMKAAHERARSMLDSTPLCCMLWGENYELYDCNEEALRMFDVGDKAEFLRSFQKFSPEFQKDGKNSDTERERMIKEAFGGKKSVYEWTHKNLSGEEIPTNITFARVLLEDGCFVAEYIRDMREHKQMMRDIYDRDAMLKTLNLAAEILLKPDSADFEADLLFAMGILAQTVGADRVYIWRNYTKGGQVRAKKVKEWEKTPNEAERINDVSLTDMPRVWETLSNGGNINAPIDELLSDADDVFGRLGARGVKSVFIAPVFMREWGFVGFVGFENYRNEMFSENETSVLVSASLLMSNALVRNDMTQNLKEQAVRLEEALASARLASKAKSNFLSNMSHEIRTPINAIIGMTAIGKKAKESERKDYALEKIEDASSHLLGIINDVLDMSKIEAGKFNLSLIDFSFERMLRKVINVNIFRIDAKKQKLTVHLDKNIPENIIGDDQRLAQVITNLLANSVKFTPEKGRIRLDARLAKGSGGLCDIYISVKDSGIGISEEQQSRLFDSFEQAENSTTRKYGGTGLGLAISKHIVELMGGEIHIKSALGEGATFYFNILASPGRPEINETNEAIKKAGLNILYVDSDAEYTECFTEAAERLDINVFTAQTADTAARLAGESSFDAVFLESNAEMFASARQIKDRLPKTHIFALTGAENFYACEHEAKDAGIESFLSYPVLASDIALCLKKCGRVVIKNEDKADEASGDFDFKGRNVLLAEDIDINREIMLSILAPYGINMDMAENGAVALETFKNCGEKYDLIFMDVQMPEMDGLTATRLIRALPGEKAKNIPIIAMTANVFAEDIEKCLESGMSDHVGKPFNMDELLEKMRAHLMCGRVWLDKKPVK